MLQIYVEVYGGVTMLVGCVIQFLVESGGLLILRDAGKGKLVLALQETKLEKCDTNIYVEVYGGVTMLVGCVIQFLVEVGDC
jgi:hypothetical protein